MNAPLITAIISYLLGSIPFGYLLVLIFRGEDVRKTGSGNIGATNVARTGSKRLAIATLLLDALKGYAAVCVAFRMNGSRFHYLPPPTGTLADMGNVTEAMHAAFLAAALAAFCALLGHTFPVWLRFKGGKGVATALGAFIAIVPLAVTVVLIVFVIAVAVTRYVSLGSMLGAALFPMAAWWLQPYVRTAEIMLFICASSLMIIVRHKDNIRRLLSGTENKFR